MARKLVIVQVAALGRELLERHGITACDGLEFKSALSVFPALTCPVQAAFRTASQACSHGMIANGLYRRDLRRAMFWEQSSGLVAGERIWADLRRRGGRAGMMFWQQSLGEQADLLLSPAPIHKHHGGMIQDCYGQPPTLYARLRDGLGKPFKLMQYWGPLASAKVGDWIADAADAVLGEGELAPDLLLTYLPSLDYDLQRWGPGHQRCRPAVQRTMKQIARVVGAARTRGYDVLVFGDYAIADCSGAVQPNQALLAEGFLRTRRIKEMLYLDPHTSRAFAMVDHELAHVYVRDEADVGPVADCLSSLGGIAEVLDREAQARLGINHPNSGELVLLAQQGRWLAYPWWTARRQAPDFATHVDIHNKPGYDPCELFSGWPPIFSVSLDPGRVRGTHGRAGPERQVAWASSLALDGASSLIDLAQGVREWLNG